MKFCLEIRTGAGLLAFPHYGDSELRLAARLAFEAAKHSAWAGVRDLETGELAAAYAHHRYNPRPLRGEHLLAPQRLLTPSQAHALAEIYFNGE